MHTDQNNIGLTHDQLHASEKFLNEYLANLIHLSNKTQVCHWNIEDAKFHMLHEMFEDQYNQLSETIDEIAERLRMLGLKTPLGLKSFVGISQLEDIESQSASASDMISALLKDHETLCQKLRPAIQNASENNDEGTADLLIGKLQEHEKTAWMLRSSM